MYLSWCVEWLVLYILILCKYLCGGYVSDYLDKAMDDHERKLTKEVRDVADKATKTVKVMKRTGERRLKKNSQRLICILLITVFVTSIALVAYLYTCINIEETIVKKSTWIKYGFSGEGLGKERLGDNSYLHNLMNVLLLGSCSDSFDVKNYLGMNKISLLRQGICFPEHRDIFVYPSSIQRYFEEYKQQKPREELMKYEWARYETFKTFPQWSPAMPTRLASTGFYYTGRSDEVRCFFCGLKHEGWQSDDIPSLVHKSQAPDCHMVLDPLRVNVPIDDSGPAMGAAAKHELANVECDEALKEHTEKMEAASSHGTRNKVNKSQPIDEMLRNSKHPQYVELEARLDSFRYWPIRDIMEPRHLATAGFYYAGFADCVRCFHCGGGLRNWDRGDCAMTEHARVFPSCEYIINKNIKGHHGAHESTNCKSSSHMQIQNNSSYYRDTVLGSSADERAYMRTCSTVSTRPETDSVSRDVNKTCGGHIVAQPETPISCEIVQDKKVMKKKTQGLQDLKQHVVCKICMDKYSEIVFLPCGHLIACSACAPNIRKCAMCRAKIKGQVRALMS